MTVDVNTVIIFFGALFIWAAGAYGSYRALSDLFEDEVVAMVFGFIWPATWPLVGVLGVIWRGE
jgi:hypothetical protein